MADESSEKTEAPTPRRRAEAREKGQVARSTDLNAAVLILVAIVLIAWTGQNLIGALMGVLQHVFSAESLADHAPGNLTTTLFAAVITVGRASLPLLVGIMIAAILINIFQVGFHLTPKKLQPKLSSLNPLKGAGRLFGQGGRSWVQLLFNLIKLCLIAGVCYSAVAGKMGTILSVSSMPIESIFLFAGQVIFDIALRFAVALLIIAILDFAWQKFRHEKDLKMSKQDLKDEMKKMEGDPVIKQRRRQIQIQRAMRRINAEVPKADVVVTNPTHFAVALKYDGDSMAAPRVVAKGADYLALRIRDIAKANGIPVIERPPLARGLYRACEVGQEIPEQFYSAVAEILAYVWEITGRARQRMARS
jgi:flagellar biosynthetic protein FlhB